jgi:hypothetical protein
MVSQDGDIVALMGIFAYLMGIFAYTNDNNFFEQAKQASVICPHRLNNDEFYLEKFYLEIRVKSDPVAQKVTREDSAAGQAVGSRTTR